MLDKKRLVIVALSFLAVIAVVFTQNAFAAAKPFVFGLLMVGPHDDQGLSQAHYEGGKYVVERHMEMIDESSERHRILSWAAPHDGTTGSALSFAIDDIV